MRRESIYRADSDVFLDLNVEYDLTCFVVLEVNNGCVAMIRRETRSELESGFGPKPVGEPSKPYRSLLGTQCRGAVWPRRTDPDDEHMLRLAAYNAAITCR